MISFAEMRNAVRVLDRLLRQRDERGPLHGVSPPPQAREAAQGDGDSPCRAVQASARRRACYRELLALTEATATYATCALAHLEGLASAPARDRLCMALRTLLPRIAQVIEQTTRRVLQDESVPAADKLVSLFEAHADVLVKDRRTTYYGHKIFLTTGRSGLILDCAIPKGNPGDVTWAVSLVRRQQRLFGQAPRQVSLDGAFASLDNLLDAGVTRSRGCVL